MILNQNYLFPSDKEEEEQDAGLDLENIDTDVLKVYTLPSMCHQMFFYLKQNTALNISQYPYYSYCNRDVEMSI